MKWKKLTVVLGFFVSIATTEAMAKSPLQAASQAGEIGPDLQVVYQFGDDFHLVGLGVSHEGRVFATAPAMGPRSRYSLVEVDLKNKKLIPYPDESWNNFDPNSTAHLQWLSVQALWVDRDDHLWALDSSVTSVDQTRLPPKLVEFDLKTNRVIRQYTFEGVITPKDSLNDVRIDLVHGYAYLTNILNGGGLVVLDLKTGMSRLVLSGDRSSLADPNEHLMLNNRPARKPDGSILEIHTDGIALSPDNTWLYYRPLTDHNYWRIPTAALRDEHLSPETLSSQVQYLGRSVLSGGIIMDYQDTLFVGDLEGHSIVALAPKSSPPGLTERVFVKDKARLAWPDGFAISGGYLYLADSHLNEIAFQNNLPRTGPFTIYKVRLPKSR